MTVKTMKAVRLHEFGGPEVLRYEDAPMPELKAGEVLVRVHAVGINPPDWYLRDGYRTLPPEWQPTVPFPPSRAPTSRASSRRSPTDVGDFSVGDEVYGMVRFPSFGESAAYAEYVAAPASDLARKPARIDHVHAAGVPDVAADGVAVPGRTRARRAEPVAGHAAPADAARPGRTVLVNGAAGGVGHFAVQVAKLEGRARHRRGVERARGVPARPRRRRVHRLHEDRAGRCRARRRPGARRAWAVPTSRALPAHAEAGGALFPVFPLGFTGAEDAARQGVHGVGDPGALERRPACRTRQAAR